MGRSKETWNKKEAEKKKQKKRKDKEQKREERKTKDKASFDNMIAYVDENGNIVSTPPDPSKKKVIREEEIEVSVRKQPQGEPMDVIRTGKVTFFNDSKGYGFIQDKETQERVFVHVNALTESIKESDTVTFEVEMGHKGPNAVNVKVVH